MSITAAATKTTGQNVSFQVEIKLITASWGYKLAYSAEELAVCGSGMDRPDAGPAGSCVYHAGLAFRRAGAATQRRAEYA